MVTINLINLTESEKKYIQKLLIRNKKIRYESKKRKENKIEYFKTLEKKKEEIDELYSEISNYRKWLESEEKYTYSLLHQGLKPPMSPAEKMIRYRINKKYNKVLDELEVLNAAGIVDFNSLGATAKTALIY